MNTQGNEFITPVLAQRVLADLLALNSGGSITNVQFGTATLVGGTKTIATGITVTASSVVMVSRLTPGGTVGHLDSDPTHNVVGAPGTGSIRIDSSSGTETSSVVYLIIN